MMGRQAPSDSGATKTAANPQIPPLEGTPIEQLIAIAEGPLRFKGVLRQRVKETVWTREWRW